MPFPEGHDVVFELMDDSIDIVVMFIHPLKQGIKRILIHTFAVLNILVYGLIVNFPYFYQLSVELSQG